MGFDQNSRRPLVIWRKWTTETNLGMVVGMVIFLVVGRVPDFFLEPKFCCDRSLSRGNFNR